jgi:hypothetical protein
MKTEIDSALTNAARSTMSILLDQGAFNILADSFVAKTGFRLLQNKDYTFTLSRNYRDNLVPFFNHLLLEEVITVCEHTDPKTWGLMDDILSDVLSPDDTKTPEDPCKENPTAASKWNTKPIITRLMLFHTRNITGNIDHSPAMQQKQSEIIALASRDFKRQFPDAPLGGGNDRSYIDGKLVRLINEADEELANYQIIINVADVPGRVEIQCIYVAAKLLEAIQQDRSGVVVAIQTEDIVQALNTLSDACGLDRSESSIECFSLFTKKELSPKSPAKLMPLSQ